MKRKKSLFKYIAFVIQLGVLAYLTQGPYPLQATITVSGNITTTSGAPYYGTDDPWITNNLIIGSSSLGNMVINDGSVVTNSVNSNIGLQAGASTSTANVSGAGSRWTNSGNLTIGNSGSASLSISDGGYVSNQAGTIGANSGTSTVTVGGGIGSSTWLNSNTMSVGNTGSGTLTILGGGSVQCTNTRITNHSVMTVGDGTGLATLTGTGQFMMSRTGTLNINSGGSVTTDSIDADSINNSINFNGGTLRILQTDTDSATPTLNFNLLASGGTFDIPTTGTKFTITSVVAGAGKLTKTGAATIELKAKNTYSGGTVINGGITLANNTVGSATGTGGVTVNNNAIFGGTGAISGSLTVNAGGTVAPGGSQSMDIGALSLTNSTSHFNPTLALNGTFESDLLNVNGTVSLTNSILDISLVSPIVLTTTRTFIIVQNDGSDAVNGFFGSINAPNGYAVSINYAFVGTDASSRIGNGNDIAITLTSIPEPSSIALAVCGVGIAAWTLRMRKLLQSHGKH